MEAAAQHIPLNLPECETVIIPTPACSNLAQRMLNAVACDLQHTGGIAMGAMEIAIAKHKDAKKRATVIYRRDEQILFVRKRNAKWNLPGGRVEKDETPLQAALREMAEETGLNFDQLCYVSEYEEDKVVHFLFEASQTLAKKPRPRNEIDDCRWFSAEELGKRNVRGPILSLLKQCGARQVV
jgi:8-oxo-dGTP diphosphatase